MPNIEIGTQSNPLVFTGVIAGQATEYANNPIYLWNDKGNIHQSVDAKEITLKVLAMNIENEIVGTSNGTASQTFNTGYFPVIQNDSNNPFLVKVNDIIWSEVSSFVYSNNTAQVYTINYSTGLITFGDGLTGAIPSVGAVIEVSYSPDSVEFGAEVSEFNWLEVLSQGVVSNPRIMYLERAISSDATHVAALSTPILSVAAVWLNEDTNRLGTNYYTGGTFNAATGMVTLGTALPNAEDMVLIDYTYTIEDDAEASYSPIGQNTSHAFFYPIPSNNAKKIYLRINPPATVSPSGMMTLQFRLRLDLKA